MPPRLAICGFSGIPSGMIQIGDTLNLDVELMAVRGGEKKKMPLRALIEGPAILSVYMKNNTSACDKQIISLVEHAEAFQQRGVTLIGLSKDTGGSHLKYAEAKGIPFPLVSDPDKRFAEMTDSLVEKSMYGKKYLAPSRSAYLVDASGKVLGIAEKVDPPNHAQQLFDLLDQAGL